MWGLNYYCHPPHLISDSVCSGQICYLSTIQQLRAHFTNKAQIADSWIDCRNSDPALNRLEGNFVGVERVLLVRRILAVDDARADQQHDYHAGDDAADNAIVIAVVR